MPARACKKLISLYDLFSRFGSDPMPMEALSKARIRVFGQAGDRSEVPNTLIFITKSMRKEMEIMREAGKLKLEGTNVIGIGNKKRLFSVLLVCILQRRTFLNCKFFFVFFFQIKEWISQSRTKSFCRQQFPRQ